MVSTAFLALGISVFVIAVVLIVIDPYDTRRVKQRIKQFDADNKYWRPDDTFLNLRDVRKNPKTYRSYKLLTWKPDRTMMLRSAYSAGEEDRMIVKFAEGWTNISYNARKRQQEKDRYILESMTYVDGIENFQKIVDKTQKTWEEKTKLATEEAAKVYEETLKEMFDNGNNAPRIVSDAELQAFEQSKEKVPA